MKGRDGRTYANLVVNVGWYIVGRGDREVRISVDVPARAKRFRETLDDPGAGGIWVLADAGQVVGWITAHQPGTTGVFSFGMALLPRASGHGGSIAAVAWLTSFTLQFPASRNHSRREDAH